MQLNRRVFLLTASALLLSSCATAPDLTTTAESTPPIVFMHGNGDSAALWQTTIWRFESNGWPRDRLFTVNVPYPLARAEDARPEPGRTSAEENMQYLQAAVDQALRATGAKQVVLMGNSRGGNAIRSYVEEARKHGQVNKIAAAILGGTPNHGVWAIKGFREGNEFSGTGPFLSGLNAPKNAAGDEVVGPVRWMTIRSDNNDKYAQPDGVWIGAKGKPTNVSYAGPELKGATNIVIPGVDHRETAYSAPAFAAAYRFITGHAPATQDIIEEQKVVLSGKVTGLGLKSDDPKSGNYSNNLALPGARLQVFAVRAGDGEHAGERIGAAQYAKTIGSDGSWGPFNAQPGQPYEFVISAPGYATTHIYRSGFPRSSAIVHLRAARIADADKDAGAIVILNRPRGYLDLERDRMQLDGKTPPGVPPGVAGKSESKLLLKDAHPRAISAEFNGERIPGRTWSAADGHIVELEITQ